MRVLVTGGRDFADRAAVFAELDALRERYGPLTIIQGGARGADMLARMWCAAQKNVRMINEPADWKAHGKAAGPIRNGAMLVEHRPELVIAFPRANGEWGSGTLDMIRQATSAGIPVRRIEASELSARPLPHARRA